MPRSTTRVPGAIYILALTVFCLGTSEFMIAGLLPRLADDLSVTIPVAGGLISAFAIGMLVGAPLMALLTLRLPRRMTLVGAAGVFALAHLVVLVTDSYGVIFASRVVAAVACATFWAVSAVIIVSITPKERVASGLGILVAGLTAANVIGVPAGTWIGQQLGWRSAFLAVATATVLAGVAVLLRVPETRPARAARLGSLVRAEIRSVLRVRLGVALGTAAVYQAGIIATFAYLSVLLVGVSGLPESAVPGVLLAFGIGTFGGVAIGSRFADRDPFRNVVVSIVGTAGSVVLLVAVAGNPVLVVGAVMIFGVVAFSAFAALTARVFAFAGEAPTLASGINVSAYNVGNAAGPALGGAVIAAGLPVTATGVVSLAFFAAALLLTGVSWVLERHPRTGELAIQPST